MRSSSLRWRRSPWAALITLIEPHYPKASKKGGRPDPQLVQLVRDRWSIEGWHWIRDTQHEDAHRYRAWRRRDGAKTCCV